VDFVGSVMIVNPMLLCRAVTDTLENYCASLLTDMHRFEEFRSMLRSYFEHEISS